MEETESTITTSVLIISHNCEQALRRCLAALEASEQRETFEILVVDKGSVDGSGQLDSEFPNVTILRLPRNFGRTQARNIGTRTAKGKFLLLLEPNIEVAPGAVFQLTAALEAEAAAVAVCPLLLDARGRAVSRTAPLPSPGSLYRAWAAGKPWMDTTAEPLPVGVAESGGSPPEVAGATPAPVPGPDQPGPGEPSGPSPFVGRIPVECPEAGAVLARNRFIKGMNYFDKRYGEFGSDLELFTQARRALKKIYVLPSVTAISREGEGLRTPSASAALTMLAADYGGGIVTYVSKHYGWMAGMKIRFRMLLRALATFQIGLLAHLLSGQKIDGSQQEI